MKKRKKNRANRGLLAAGLATATLISGCGKSGKKWANSPGTNGFINLDAVKEAFQKNPKVEDFQRRVNEIFEGDNVIIFASEKMTGGFVLTAKEDLDQNKEVSSEDETLFTLSVIRGEATLQGAGANKYYKASWACEPEKKKDEDYKRPHYHGPHFHHWYWGRYWGRYYTPAPGYDKMKGHRNSYRATPAFHSQVNDNLGFENRMAKRYGSGFRKSVGSSSTVRRNYINRTVRSSGFKSSLSATKGTSGWGIRATSGTKSAFSSGRSSARGGGRGFGGRGGARGFGI